MGRIWPLSWAVEPAGRSRPAARLRGGGQRVVAIRMAAVAATAATAKPLGL